MTKVRIFIFMIFFSSLGIAFSSKGFITDFDVYTKALILFWFFSVLYYHLRIISKKGNATIDYGITYSLSFGVFTGPLGLLVFETIYRFSVYFYKKWTKTDDPDEFLHTFYNIGAFVIFNSIAFYLYQALSSTFQNILFGYWILMIILVIVISLLSDLFLITIFSFLGEIKSKQDAINFFKSRSILDMGKTSFTNGLLIIFLMEERWEMLISLFILNFLVSSSFVSKAQNIQDKIERDKFEQMAYTDFLTGLYNRAFMDKKMAELNQTEEFVGIVVADIDKFKKINDSYNHSVGDQVIKHFASTLKSQLSEHDLLFRSGGEEFTLFLRNREFSQTKELIEKILHDQQKSSVTVEFKSKPTTISYTASFGLYYFKVNEKVDMERGYIFADHLLLQSKELGRNKLSIKNEQIEQDTSIQTMKDMSQNLEVVSHP